MNITHKSAQLRYSIGILRHGRVVDKRDVSYNLLLDAGLDKVRDSSLVAGINTMLLGDQVSPTPVRVDSGTITLTQTGTSITASGSFFAPIHTGQLLKYNDGPGTEVYLTYVSPTTAIASVSASVGPVNGTVWAVNQTALESFVVATTTRASGGGAHGSSWSGNIQTNKLTLVSAPEVGSITYTEIGFGFNGDNVDIFDRDIITGGLTLLPGDQALCVVEVIITYDPTPVVLGNRGTGCDTSGTLALESGALFDSIDSSGNINSGALENYGIKFGLGDFTVVLDSYTQSAFSTVTAPILPSHVQTFGAIQGSYVSGSFVQPWTSGPFGIASFNGLIYALCIAGIGGDCGISLVLDIPFVKDGTQTFQFSVSLSWARTLVN